MAVVSKCACCGAILETKGDETAGVEVSHSLCQICKINIEDAKETDLIITIPDSPTT
jgi:hypothetical protein